MDRRKILEAEWSPENTERFEKFSDGSKKKAWWKCNKATCGHHRWEARIFSRSKGTDCPFCSGRTVCPCNSLEKINPKLAAEWHPKNKLKPSEVSVSSGKRAWWKCKKMACGHHVWEASIAGRTRGRGCPFCRGLKVCPCNSLETLRPELAAEWHPKNKLKPSEVPISSSKKVWWKCPKTHCDHHDWEASIINRTKKRSGCPFCSGNKVCPCNSLENLRPDIAAEWHPENELKPSEVTVYSNKKVWWKCNKSNYHEWESIISNRTGKNARDCPFCRIYKGEQILKDILDKKGLNYIFQKKLNYRRFSFDFFLPDLNTAIEFDGRQHFEPVEFFGGEKQFKKQRENDLYKILYCSDHKINLMKIHFKDTEEIEFLIDFSCGVSSSKTFGPNSYILWSTNYPKIF